MSFPDPLPYLSPEGNQIVALPEVGNGTPTTTTYRGKTNATTSVETLIRQTRSKTRIRSEFRMTHTFLPAMVGEIVPEPVVCYFVIDRSISKLPSVEATQFMVGSLKASLTTVHIAKLFNEEL